MTLKQLKGALVLLAIWVTAGFALVGPLAIPLAILAVMSIVLYTAIVEAS